MSAVLEVSGLTRTYGGSRALDEVSLRIEDDAVVGLLGRNGAGKTTLMRLLTGLEFPSSGTVRVFGEDPLENQAVLARTCFVRESQRYPNNVQVRHVMAAGRQFHEGWDADLADRLVEDFGLPRRCQVARLSRGMRAAVGIVVGLAANAPLTIFDEPHLGLDATARQQFYDELLKAHAEHPRTVLLSTHLIDEVGPLLERVVVLDRGRVVLDDDAEDARRRACTLTGPAGAVDAMVAGLPVLHREPMGGYSRVTIDLPADAALRRTAAEVGVEVGSVSLQSLVVRSGLAASASTARGEC